MADSLTKLHNAAIQALNRGAYEQAARLCKELLEQDQHHADGWFLMGMVAAANLRIAKAVEMVDNAISLAPENAEYWAQKAKLHTLLNQNGEARTAADTAMQSDPASALTLDTLGVVYTKIGAYEAAQPALQEAVSLKPGNAQFHFNLASAEQFLGNAEAANTHYGESIRLQPNFYRAHWALSELNKNKHVPERIGELETLLAAADLGADDELYLAHALATEYEKAGDYDRAFNTLERGKRRRTTQISYSVKRDERMFEALQNAFPAAAVGPATAHDAGEQAIFVVGMPRTGTTLVEQILDSHGQVVSLGELQDFALTVKAASNTPSRLVLDETVIAAVGGQDMAMMGTQYLAAINDRLGATTRFVDKMPLNFLYVGFILSALPKAKIVCLRRNPLDTCLSNFRQLFAIHFSYYNYHYDLTDTALYYILFDGLMRHWRSIYGERIYELKYEALTAEPDAQVRALLDYLELPWDPTCLDFHSNKRAVATASTMQVRQPIYQSAVARWKKYEPHLADVKSIFDRHGIDYGN